MTRKCLLILVCGVLATTLTGLAPACRAQDYVYATGNPNFGVQYPVPDGYINVTNGNVHLTIPLGKFKQRGTLPPIAINLEYDSRIWQIVQDSSGNKSWQPTNVPYSYAGWRLVTGAEATNAPTFKGPITLPDGTGTCGTSGGSFTTAEAFTDFVWTDAGGTKHTFNTELDQSFPPPSDSSCPSGGPQFEPANAGGYAIDGSGYYLSATYQPNNDTDPSNGNTIQMTVFDSKGNEVYPIYLDAYGNTASLSAAGTLVDSTGRTLLTTTTSGDTTTYNVLKEGGEGSEYNHYTVTTLPIAVNTSFNQSAVTDYSGGLPAPTGSELPGVIRNITLPDGSSYSFIYDWSLGGAAPYYGELLSMTLPTSGVVTFNYSNFNDSYNNENRWIVSETDGGGTAQFTPSVLTQCSDGQVTNGNGQPCQDKMTVNRPSGGDRVYTLTLNDGAWNGQTDTYGGSDVMTVVNNYDFKSYPCPTYLSGAQICNGAMYIKASSSTATLNDINPSLTAETDYAYTDPSVGGMKVSTIKYFDYGVSNTGTASRETDYIYNSSSFVQQKKEYYWDQYLGPNVEYANTSYTYDKGGQIQTETKTYNSGGSATTLFAYDGNGMKSSETDPNGNVTSYSYGCAGLYLSTTTYPSTNSLSHVEQISPDCSTGLPLSETDENSQPTTYIYDSLGRKSSVTYPDRGVTTYTYVPATETSGGQTMETRTVSPGVSNTTITTLDTYGRKSTVQTSDPSDSSGYDTVTTTYGANNDNRVSCVTNPERSTATPTTDGQTCFIYDELDRPMRITQPDGAEMYIAYQGNQAAVTDEDGNTKTYTYDAFHDLTSVIESSGWKTIYTYNPGGNLRVATQNGDGSKSLTRTFTYDHDRLISEQTPEAGSKSYSYYPNGNLKTVTTGLGQITYIYDALNRVTAETGGSLNNTYTYDALTTGGGFSSQNAIGRLVETSTGANVSEQFSYDSMGRIAYQANCLPGNCSQANAVFAQYDQAGDLVALTYPDGRSVNQSFDAALHLKSVQFNSMNGQNLIQMCTLSGTSYAPPGELTSATYGSGVMESASFNSRNTITALSYTLNGTPLWSKQYQWENNAKNLLRITDTINSAHSAYYTYDADNRLTSFNEGNTLKTAATPSGGSVYISGSEQQPANPCAGNQYMNNCPVYDSGSIEVTVDGQYAGSTGWGQGSYTGGMSTALAQSINSNSNSLVTATVNGAAVTLTSKATGIAANYPNVQVSVSWTSQSNGNVPLFSGPSFSASGSSSMTGGQDAIYGGVHSEAYNLDPWGNVKESGDYSFEPTAFSAANQISSTGYGYDWAGDLTQDPNGNTYAYNADGTLAASGSTQYTYDAMQQRVQKTGGGNPGEFVYFAGHAVAVLNPQTGAWTDLIYAGDNLIAEAGANQQNFTYRLLDHLGSAAATTDASGNVTGTNDYAPYGPLLATSTSDPYLYTGLYQDAEYGGYHAWHRNESAEQIRWLTPDPYNGSYDVMDPQSLNRYAYLNGNPMDGTDPSGLTFGLLNGVGGGICKAGKLIASYDNGPIGFNPCNPVGSLIADAAVAAVAYVKYADAATKASGFSNFLLGFKGSRTDMGTLAAVDAAITVFCSIDPNQALCGPKGGISYLIGGVAGKVVNDSLSVGGAVACLVVPGGWGCIGDAIYQAINDLLTALFGPPKFTGSLLPRPSDFGGLGTAPIGIPNQNLTIRELLESTSKSAVPSPGMVHP